MDRFGLDDKVAVVTGASFGLGYGMAEGFAEAGARIVAVSRNRENLSDIESAVQMQGQDCLPLACDVADRSQVRAMEKGARPVRTDRYSGQQRGHY